MRKGYNLEGHISPAGVDRPSKYDRGSPIRAVLKPNRYSILCRPRDAGKMMAQPTRVCRHARIRQRT